MKYRPDLTDYLPCIEALTDRLNEDAIYKMSRTDEAAQKHHGDFAVLNFPRK
jgi:hypothetical protein